jgi:hypothetical protein
VRGFIPRVRLVIWPLNVLADTMSVNPTVTVISLNSFLLTTLVNFGCSNRSLTGFISTIVFSRSSEFPHRITHCSEFDGSFLSHKFTFDSNEHTVASFDVAYNSVGKDNVVVVDDDDDDDDGDDIVVEDTDNVEGCISLVENLIYCAPGPVSPLDVDSCFTSNFLRLLIALEWDV